MHAIPQQLAEPANAVAIAAGREFSIAMDSNGEVWSWGRYLNGQLGRIGNSLVPAKISGLPKVKAISAGAEHALAVDVDGGVWAWGRNADGNLGDGETKDRSVPVRVTGVPPHILVAAGQYHSLGLAADGTVWAWGRNSDGQLGDQTTDERRVPTMVPGLAEIVGIAAAGSHSLAWSSDGTLWAWGSNEDGQLGAGSSSRIVTSPVGIGDIGRITHAVAGSRHTLATREDGLVWAWGRNFEGQLGDGTFAAYNQPVLAVNQTLTGVLDLNSLVTDSIPTGKYPPFLARATRTGDLSGLSLSVEVKGISITGIFASEMGRFAATYNVYVGASVSSGGTPIYFQLDAINTWSTLRLPMAEYLRGVTLDSQNDVVTAQLLQNVDLSGLPGAEILVGYGTDSDEMLGSKRYRVIFTVPAQ